MSEPHSQELYNISPARIQNMIARELRRLYKIVGEIPSESVIFNLEAIEKATGIMNQPSCEEILNSKRDI